MTSKQTMTFSIRTLLLAFVFIAVLVTVGRWLILNQPMLIPPILALTFTVFPFLAAIISLYRLAPKAENPKRVFVWSTLLLIAPVLGLLLTSGVAAWIHSQPAIMAPAAGQPIINQPHYLRQITTDEIVALDLSAAVEAPWVWQVLAERINSRELDSVQTRKVLDDILAYVEGKKASSQRIQPSWVDGFLVDARAARLLSDEDVFELLQAFQSEPTASFPRIREGQTRFGFSIEYESEFRADLGFETLWDVKEIKIDGKPFEFERENRSQYRFSGRHEQPVPPGDHTINVTLECRLVDKQLMEGLRQYNLPRSAWPLESASWEEKLEVPFKVFGTDESMIRIANTKESEADPIQSKLKLKRAMVQIAPGQRRGNVREEDRKKILIFFELVGEPTIPLSYDVEVRHGDKLITTDSIVVYRSKDGLGVSRRLKVQSVLPDLDSSIGGVDVILKPNPKHLESKSHIDVISGQSLKFPNVLLERVDLDAGKDVGKE